jgi:hypothetical protein
LESSFNQEPNAPFQGRGIGLLLILLDQEETLEGLLCIGHNDRMIEIDF